jgi:hypothetical protein
VIRTVAPLPSGISAPLMSEMRIVLRAIEPHFLGEETLSDRRLSLAAD